MFNIGPTPTENLLSQGLEGFGGFGLCRSVIKVK